MLRKTLAATPQAKQDRGRGTARGASQNRGPPQLGRQLKQGRGPTGISGGGWSSVGQSGGLPWGPPGQTSTAKPRASSTCQPEPGRAASAYRAHGTGAQQGGPEGGLEGGPEGRPEGGPEGGPEGDKGKGFRRCKRQAAGPQQGQNPQSDTGTLTKLDSKHVLKQEGEEQTGEARQDHPDN